MSSENVVIAGDLNAGGTFVKPADWAQCRLRGEEYSWLIPDHLDTTATNTLAAYDRQDLDTLCPFDTLTPWTLTPCELYDYQDSDMQ